MSFSLSEHCFPDLHHMLSKKIAQLTKVIYHLQISKEENESQLNALSNRFQTEKEEILLDAEMKIGEFKKQLESAKSDARLKEAVKKLQSEHSEERKKALTEFEKFKEKAKEMQVETRKQYEGEISRLKKDMRDMTEQFETRIRSFRDIETTLDTQWTRRIEEQRQQHELELSTHVQEANRKYNEMLTKKLEEMENERVEWEKDTARQLALANDQQRKSEQEIRQQMAEMKRSLETEINKLRGMLRDRDADLDKARQNNTSALTDAQQECNSLRNKIREWEFRVDELTQEVERLNKLNSTQKSNYEERISELERRLASLNGERVGLEKEKVSWEAEKVQFQNRIRQLEGQTSNTSDRLGSIEQQNEKLQRMYDTLKSEKDRLALDLESLRMQYNALEDERVSMRNEMSTLRESLNLSDQQLREMRKQSENDVGSLQSRYDRKCQDFDAVCRQLEDLQRQLAVERDQWAAESAKEKSALENRIAELNAVVDSRKSDLGKASSTISQLEADIRKALTASQRNQQTQQEELIALRSEKEKLLAEIEALKSDFSELKRSSDRTVSDLERLRRELDELYALKQRIDAERKDALSRLESIRRDSDYGRAESDKKIRDLESQCQAMENRLRVSESHEQDLRIGMDDLRREMRALEIDKDARLNEVRDQLQADHLEEMQRLERKLRGLLDGERMGEVSRLREEHEEEMDRLKREYENRLKEMEGKLADKIEEIRGLQEMIEMLRNQMGDDEKRFQELLKKSQLESESAMEMLRSQLSRDHAIDIQHRESLHHQRIHEMTESHVQTIRDLEVRLTEERRLEERRMSEQFARERQQMRIDHVKDMDELRSQMEDENERLVKHVRETKDSEIQALKSELSLRENRIAEFMASVENLQDTIQHLESQLKSTEESRRLLEMQLKDAIRSMDASLADKQARWRDETEMKLRALGEEHLKEIRALETQIERNRQLTEEEKQLLLDKIADLQYRYDHRESLPEDIETIQRLKDYIMQQEELVRQAQEQVKYFKLELLNREESYNKNFSRSPTVGLLDPLASRTSSQTMGIGNSRPPMTTKNSSGSLTRSTSRSGAGVVSGGRLPQPMVGTPTSSSSLGSINNSGFVSAASGMVSGAGVGGIGNNHHGPSPSSSSSSAMVGSGSGGVRAGSSTGTIRR